jgi:hypothetical protein
MTWYINKDKNEETLRWSRNTLLILIDIQLCIRITVSEIAMPEAKVRGHWSILSLVSRGSRLPHLVCRSHLVAQGPDVAKEARAL